MKAQITITPTESKRLIAKAVKEHEKVKKALKRGIVAIGLGTTNAFVVEEILNKQIEKERYAAGIIYGGGACVVPTSKRLKEVIIEDGRVIEGNIGEIARKMNNRDVFIKGANAIDKDGLVGVMMASLTGGTIAKVLGILKARGTNIIIPVSLEKFIPSSITEVSNATGIYQMGYSMGIPVGVMPFSGEIITEIEALKILTNTKTTVIGSGGIGSGEGSKTFLIEGREKDVKKAFAIVEDIKGEKPVEALPGNCKTCEHKHCPKNLKKKV